MEHRKIDRTWTATIQLHCTLAWCSQKKEKVDTGMGVSLALELVSLDGIPGELTLLALKKSVHEELDHKPIRTDAVLSASGVAQEVCQRVENMIVAPLSPVSLTMEIRPDIFYRFTWGQG